MPSEESMNIKVTLTPENPEAKAALINAVDKKILHTHMADRNLAEKTVALDDIELNKQLTQSFFKRNAASLLMTTLGVLIIIGCFFIAPVAGLAGAVMAAISIGYLIQKEVDLKAYQKTKHTGIADLTTQHKTSVKSINDTYEQHVFKLCEQLTYVEQNEADDELTYSSASLSSIPTSDSDSDTEELSTDTEEELAHHPRIRVSTPEPVDITKARQVNGLFSQREEKPFSPKPTSDAEETASNAETPLFSQK